jgi:uncharacterized membrane protein
MVLLPPSVLLGAAAGAAAGATANNMNKHIARSDATGLAQLLDPGESGILVVVEDVEKASLLQRATQAHHSLTSVCHRCGCRRG